MGEEKGTYDLSVAGQNLAASSAGRRSIYNSFARSGLQHLSATLIAILEASVSSPERLRLRPVNFITTQHTDAEMFLTRFTRRSCSQIGFF